MTKEVSKKVLLLIIFTVLVAFLYSFTNDEKSQVILKIEKGSNAELNLLESMNLNLCFEMNSYIVVAVDNTAALDRNNIPYIILTNDSQTQPLYIISPNNRQDLQEIAYIGDIVLNTNEMRIERLSSSNRELTLHPDVKYIPVRINKATYKNKRTTYTSELMNAFTRNDWEDLLESINADSIAWFIQKLEDYETRFCFHPNRLDISNWIAEQFIRWGYDNVYLEHFTPIGNYSAYNQANVVAIAEGSVFPDKYVIIGAHHDSINQEGNLWETSMIYAPGADDNASGTAAVLEIARVMKLHDYQPSSSIQFITFAMEELGLYGAYYNADQIAENNLNVAAMINADMIAYQSYPVWTSNMITYPGAEYLSDLAFMFATDLGLSPYTTSEMINRSDSWAYHSIGIPAFFLMEGFFNIHYHSSQDILENANPEYTQEMVKVMASLVFTVTNFTDNPQNYLLRDVGDGHSIYAEWDYLNSDEIIYQIRVKNTQNQAVVEYNTLNNSYLIDNLTEETEYEVTLYAIFYDNYSLGQARYITPQSIPRIVANFTDLPIKQQIHFSWEANNELDMAGYKIFRRLQDNGVFAEVGYVAHPITAWIDNTTSDLEWYEYIINAIDTDGNISPDSEVLVSRHLSFSIDVLIVNSTTSSGTNPLYPPLEALTEFYTELVSGYNSDHTLFNATNIPTIDLLGQYKTLLVHKNSFTVTINNDLKNSLNTYIDLGGNIIISAIDPLYYLGEANGPFPITFENNDFPKEYFNIDTAYFNNTARLAKAVSTHWINVPDLEVDVSKLPSNWGGRLTRLEAFAGENYQEIYTYFADSDNTTYSAFDGLTVAFYTRKGSSDIVVTTVPLYFIQQNQAQSFVQAVLGYFETTSIVDDPIPSITSLNLKNYPNPFNPTTTIEFSMPQSDFAVINIFNIKGQLVNKIDREHYLEGLNKISIDCSKFSSGVYFYQVKTDKGLNETRKMVLLK